METGGFLFAHNFPLDRFLTFPIHLLTVSKNTELLAVKVSDKLYRQIKKAAEADRRTVSDYVRIMLDEVTKNEKQARTHSHD